MQRWGAGQWAGHMPCMQSTGAWFLGPQYGPQAPTGVSTTGCGLQT